MAAECDVLSELEVLQSIYLDELLVSRREDGGWEVSLVLHPSTGEDSVSQFVRLTLTLSLSQQYPSSSPMISIHNPRGLSDDKLSSVQHCLQLEAQLSLGSPVLYQLIEKAKEILTESNIPHGDCVICLYGFKEGEMFTKTNCYHYFHSHCLGRYVSHSERELRQREKELEEDKTRERTKQQELTVVCPVCREPLTYDVAHLLSCPAPLLPELDEAVISSDFQRKWCELQKLWEGQKAKGGIIDPEVESNRFLIHINESSSAAENGNLDVDVSPDQLVSSASNISSGDAGGVGDQLVSGVSHCRSSQGHVRQSQARAPQKGRPRPQHGGATSVTDHLDKLSLSTDCTEGLLKAKPQPSRGHHVRGNSKSCQAHTGKKVYTELSQLESRASPEGQLTHQSGSDSDFTKHTVESSCSHHGRRKGPHRYYPQMGASGSTRHHWNRQRAPKNRGGAHNPFSRGGGSCRGNGRDFQQRVMEKDGVREEVL
ncbi:E3 ubiquitin-protein ligase RNF25 [Thalassophryne amazonica]|uniref:E3 ubiquitin-protein ligase RNF25 n=1 Tax=Thalassophryne amazonica TaxID=390379 RepID=UPI0014709590|nr:E3 ubiquitin-protein ligase RNF25 [Thalassophryne amazonica]